MGDVWLKNILNIADTRPFQVHIQIIYLMAYLFHFFIIISFFKIIIEGEIGSGPESDIAIDVF